MFVRLSRSLRPERQFVLVLVGSIELGGGSAIDAKWVENKRATVPRRFRKRLFAMPVHENGIRSELQLVYSRRETDAELAERVRGLEWTHGSRPAAA